MHICLGLVVEYWLFVGTYTHHSYSKLYYLCHLVSLLKLFHHPPHPYTPPAHPVIYADPILMNSMKNYKKLAKIRNYILARLVAQKLIL